MTDRGLVVVGSGPAGLAAVRAFREQDADTAVTMITADPYPPYARPPLTKDFAQGATDLDDLWLTEPGWFDAQRVELRLGTTVTGLDTARQQLRLADGTSLTYADVVLATGSRPSPLPVPGGEDPDLIYVRDLASGHRLRGLSGSGGGRVAVIGSGFIGCEAAASLAMTGVQVVLVSAEALPQEERLGPDAGREIRSWLSAAGVELLLGTPLAALRRRDGDFELELADGARAPGPRGHRCRRRTPCGRAGRESGPHPGAGRGPGGRESSDFGTARLRRRETSPSPSTPQRVGTSASSTGVTPSSTEPSPAPWRPAA